MKNIQGVSLIELLVGLAVSMVILIGAGSAFIAHNLSVSTNLKGDKLNHDLQIAMDLMISEIRRAGYWNGDISGAPATNPFQNIVLGTNCVLYSYDARNAAGANIPDGQIQDSERYGFKLSNGSIWMKTSGNAASASDCTNGSWESLTDSTLVSVTQLNFLLTAKCVNASTGTVTDASCTAGSGTTGQRTIEIRGIKVDLTGNVVGDTTTRKQANGFARIRNNSITTY